MGHVIAVGAILGLRVSVQHFLFRHNVGLVCLNTQQLLCAIRLRFHCIYGLAGNWQDLSSGHSSEYDITCTICTVL